MVSTSSVAVVYEHRVSLKLILYMRMISICMEKDVGLNIKGNPTLVT
jgi:hypothetical protein